MSNGIAVHNKKMKQEKGRKAFYNGIKMTILSLFAVIQIFPLVWLVNFSFATNQEIFASATPLIIPETWMVDNYVRAFVQGNFLLFFRNSLIVNFLAVVFVLFISILSAYACTRMRFKLSGLVLTLMILGMMIPIHATLLPNFVIYTRLGIMDTLWSLLIPYVAFSLPMGVFLTCGFMNTIPLEMEEAAVIDGCGIFRLIPTIVMPMLKPVIMTVAIMTYLTNWNEFIMTMTFLRTDTWRTLPFSVLQFVGLYGAEFGPQFAVMTLGALPAVVIFLLLSKQITKGIALGSVKG